MSRMIKNGSHYQCQLTYPTALTYTGLGSGYKPDSLKRVKIVFQTDEAAGQSAYRFVATGGMTIRIM
jgi:hypothetical protein